MDSLKRGPEVGIFNNLLGELSLTLHSDSAVFPANTGEDVRVLKCSMGCTVSSCPLDLGRERVQAGEVILKDY